MFRSCLVIIAFIFFLPSVYGMDWDVECKESIINMPQNGYLEIGPSDSSKKYPDHEGFTNIYGFSIPRAPALLDYDSRPNTFSNPYTYGRNDHNLYSKIPYTYFPALPQNIRDEAARDGIPQYNIKIFVSGMMAAFTNTTADRVQRTAFCAHFGTEPNTPNSAPYARNRSCKLMITDSDLVQDVYLTKDPFDSSNPNIQISRNALGRVEKSTATNYSVHTHPGPGYNVISPRSLIVEGINGCNTPGSLWSYVSYLDQDDGQMKGIATLHLIWSRAQRTNLYTSQVLPFSPKTTVSLGDLEQRLDNFFAPDPTSQRQKGQLLTILRSPLCALPNPPPVAQPATPPVVQPAPIPVAQPAPPPIHSKKSAKSKKRPSRKATVSKHRSAKHLKAPRGRQKSKVQRAKPKRQKMKKSSRVKAHKMRTKRVKSRRAKRSLSS